MDKRAGLQLGTGADSLLDSELFGHEAGAFTGAAKQRLRHFERADKGTLFLDEVATLPNRTQEKLLRVIEYGEFERLGGQQTVKVDIRIAAATHAYLPELAKQGRFRYDLLDRLEDLEDLIHFFATRMCSELGRPYHAGFSASALKDMAAHPWPGNIRELKNVVERGVCHWESSDEPVDAITLDPFKQPYSTIPKRTPQKLAPQKRVSLKQSPWSPTAQRRQS